MTHNRLADEPSPYLLQHKDNPVHWYPWGDEAFRAAADTGKPVLLSVGYAACHWCHVMAHESFEDQATADLMNELFINIKLDREERPDIDKIYMEALHHLGEQGGWPLTMFLNAERQPFWGGTYFPKEPQYGRPSFRDVLKQISSIYSTAPDKVETNTTALQKALAHAPKLGNSSNQRALTFNDINRTATQIQTIVDQVHGGLQGAPKFPQVPIFQLLWRHYLRTGNTISRNQTLVTLRNISQGGIYDHLGGGYARYSVDARWLAPHFEKMLYDNAQLLDLLTLAWQATKDDLFRIRIEETISWVQREMIAEHSAFAASLDADSDGEEGAFYVWQSDEIANTLNEDATLFSEFYNVTPSGNWEGKTILNRLDNLDFADSNTEARLAKCRDKLLLQRSQRNRPGRDDKILTDWNGLMIAAIANCALVFDNPEWLELAVGAYEGVKSALYRAGEFLQSHRAGQTRHPATADGYANMIRAALALNEATQNDGYLNDAETWADDLHSLFWNDQSGGYFYTSANATDLIRRTFSAADDAIPNANATMLGNLAKLYAVTGKEDYLQRGNDTLGAFTPQIFASDIAHAGALNGFEDFSELIQIVLVGDPSTKTYKDLKAAVLQKPFPSRQLTSLDKNAQLHPAHPASGKTTDTDAALFICKGQICSLPVTAVQELDATVAQLFPNGGV